MTPAALRSLAKARLEAARQTIDGRTAFVILLNAQACLAAAEGLLCLVRGMGWPSVDFHDPPRLLRNPLPRTPYAPWREPRL